MESPPKIFSITNTKRVGIRGRLTNSLLLSLEKMFLVPQMNKVYQHTLQNVQDKPFADSLLELMGTQFEVSDEDLKRIPEKGPLIVVANHPFGMIEAMGLHSLMSRVRKDLKFIANEFLGQIPEVAKLCFLVDIFSGNTASSTNVPALRDTARWLKDGGAVALFPSGEVASLNLQKRRIIEPEWTQHTARFVRMGKCQVLPIYFEGTNSVLFHAGGLIHPRLRTAFLPREFLNKRGKKLRVVIGNPIPFKKLESFDSDEKMVKHLRQRTYFLKNRLHRQKLNILAKKTIKTADFEPVSEPVETALQIRDLERLPKEQLLVSARDMDVFIAEARQIPHILQEIGRLREITFRTVGEGTGKAIDLDDFDQTYQHLFVWNRERREVVGSYRLGRVDQLIDGSVKNTLYTSSLFKFRKELLTNLNPSLELGRSFIRMDYQKAALALPLLWRGIGSFVVKNPQYKLLFGPVSISNDYHTISHRLMVRFLRDNQYLPQIARHVKCRNPYRLRPINGLKNPTRLAEVVRDIEDVSSMISDIELDGKGIPILLKEYLKLGGKLIGFNVDHDFNDVVDGLILVDLTRTDRRVLNRYLGKEGAESFLAFHQHDEVGLRAAAAMEN